MLKKVKSTWKNSSKLKYVDHNFNSARRSQILNQDNKYVVNFLEFVGPNTTKSHEIVIGNHKVTTALKNICFWYRERKTSNFIFPTIF